MINPESPREHHADRGDTVGARAAATPLPSPRATPTRRPAGKDRILETLLENTQTRRGPQPQGRLPRL